MKIKIVILMLLTVCIFQGCNRVQFIDDGNGHKLYKDDKGNYIKNEWKEINNNWYFFDRNGYLATSKWIDDEYYVDENGIMMKNYWYEGENGSIYYLGGDGKYLRNTVITIEGKEYAFDNKGRLYENVPATINIEQYIFRVPAYWEDITDTEANNLNKEKFPYVAETKNNGRTSRIMINKYIDKEDPVTYEILEKETKSGLMQMSLAFYDLYFHTGNKDNLRFYCDNMQFNNYEKFENNGINGYLYNFYGKFDGIDGIMKFLVFGSEKNNTWYYVCFGSPTDSSYGHIDDFDFIINNITDLADVIEEANGEEREDSQKADKNKNSIKEILDKYEIIVDEYVKLLKKTTQGNYDTSTYSEYLKVLQDYTELADEVNKIDTSKLSKEDYNYYLETTQRILNKINSVYTK